MCRTLFCAYKADEKYAHRLHNDVRYITSSASTERSNGTVAFDEHRAILCEYNHELLVFVNGSRRELTLLGTLLPTHFDASILLPLALCL